MCIKQLRENQKRKRYDRLPTRTSKITHMFEHFFLQKPGCGALRMMVCINPKPADFDENTHVMEFAEMTQKIQIERVEAIPKNVYTAGKNLLTFKLFLGSGFLITSLTYLFVAIKLQCNKIFGILLAYAALSPGQIIIISILLHYNFISMTERNTLHYWQRSRESLKSNLFQNRH